MVSLHLSFPLLLAALCVVVSAAKKYTIDDQDKRIKYHGNWERITNNLNFTTGANIDYKGGHMLATSPNSSATMTFYCAYLLKVNSMITKNFQPIPFPPFFLLFLFLILSGIDGLNEIFFSVSTAYFVACLWPYDVSANVNVDGKGASLVDMQDYDSPKFITGGNASVASQIIGSWEWDSNKERTIEITVPPGANFAVLDAFM